MSLNTWSPSELWPLPSASVCPAGGGTRAARMMTGCFCQGPARWTSYESSSCSSCRIAMATLCLPLETPDLPARPMRWEGVEFQTQWGSVELEGWKRTVEVKLFKNHQIEKCWVNVFQVNKDLNPSWKELQPKHWPSVASINTGNVLCVYIREMLLVSTGVSTWNTLWLPSWDDLFRRLWTEFLKTHT